MRQVLAWAMDYDPATAARLAGALGWWWWLRGRLPGQYGLLREVAGRAEVGSDGWCWVQLWLGCAANFCADDAAALEYDTALCDVVTGRGPSPALVHGLADRAIGLANLGRTGEAAEDARRALAMAREIGYRAGEINALGTLSAATGSSGDLDGAVQLARQAAQITAGVPGVLARWSSHYLTGALIGAGDLAGADEAARRGWPGPGTPATCGTSGSCCRPWCSWTCMRAASGTPRRTCAKSSSSPCAPAAGPG